MKDTALRQFRVPESVVEFLASIDEENEVHIISSYGTMYDTPVLENGFEAQCGVKQGTPGGPFSWLAVNNIVWTEVSRVPTEQYHSARELSGPLCSPLWITESTSAAATGAYKKSQTAR